MASALFSGTKSVNIDIMWIDLRLFNVVGYVEVGTDLTQRREVFGAAKPYSPELNLIEILWRQMKYAWLPLSAYLSFITPPLLR